ncbi:MAG: sulfotransferase domain-containing protein [Balneolaceae bacterium]|nr:sulfotransferase domain-containing protein [Balneolaceae bacterium]
MKKIKRIQHLYSYIQHRFLIRDSPESVYFYTFHKCASSFFSQYVLKNVNGLYHINYASQLYSGNRSHKKELEFRKKGFIYGPIRISAYVQSPVAKRLVNPTTKHDFIRDKIAIFFIRDPRDILVSSYYSFGFTHGFSKVNTIKVRQEAKRKRIREMTLDEYVLDSADKQVDLFKTLYELSKTCSRGVVLRYEDMINDFDGFAEQLRQYITLEDATIREIYQKTRPREKEDVTSHRRSGKVGGFREKLEKNTILAVNKKLAEILTLFGYQD